MVRVRVMGREVVVLRDVVVMVVGGGRYRVSVVGSELYVPVLYRWTRLLDSIKPGRRRDASGESLVRVSVDGPSSGLE